jgi:hypothetical protein
MLMPLLVRLSDSEIEMIEFMITEFSDGFDHGRYVREQVRTGGVAID